VLTGFIGAAACGQQEQAPQAAGAAPPPGEIQPGCDTAAARMIVETFGERLKNVSLLAPDSIVAAQIRANYGGLVTKYLLDGWLFHPENAPGRETSSPWPERIEIDSMMAAGAGACRVQGRVVYLTSVEVTHGGAAALQPVALRVQREEGDGWRISDYQVTTPAKGVESSGGTTSAPGAAAPAPGRSPPGETPAGGAPGATSESYPPGAPPADSATAAAAADLIRRYYAAINAREYRRAYELWGDGGKESGQTFEEFRAGFAETASVAVEVGEPGRIEGAAGSRYVEVPVVIRANTTTGETQRFSGSYTLRRAVVEGASPLEMRWHIYSAKIVRAR
jgi:hypothetical protein